MQLGRGSGAPDVDRPPHAPEAMTAGARARRIASPGDGVTALAAILLASLAACDGASPTDNDVPAVDRPILFHDFTNVFVMDATGAEVMALTSETDLQVGVPSWAPSGDHVALRARQGEAAMGLWVMSADGTGLSEVSASPVPVNGPYAWSPDGEQLAYRDQGFEMYVVDRDGRDHRSLLAPDIQGTDPAWSPSGDWIAFVGDDGERSGLFRVRSDGTDLELLHPMPWVSDHLPAYSPDGGRIAFVDGDAIHLIDADGAGLRLLSDPGEAPDQYPRWSHDGARIAHRRREAFRWRIDVRAVGDGELLATFGVATADLGYPSWSPDGDRLTFSAQNQVVVASLSDPEDLQFVGEGAWPQWHPGG